MSKRRQPGEVVTKRSPHGSILIKIPEGPTFKNKFFKKENEWEIDSEGQAEFCVLCNDSECREWPKLQIVQNSPTQEQHLNYVSECEVEDWPPKPQPSTYYGSLSSDDSPWVVVSSTTTR